MSSSQHQDTTPSFTILPILQLPTLVMASCIAQQTQQQQQQSQVKNDGTRNELCEECKTNSFKYKCPRCSRRTCSLACVNSHKKDSGCNGKRDLTQFVPLSQFDDSTLLSDYNLLEDVKRVAESAQRMRKKLCTRSPFRLPYHLQSLQSVARKTRTTLLFFPGGMSKREKNQTRYNPKTRSISWTIELRFHTTDVALLEHRVQDKFTLRSIIKRHLQPSPWRNKLRRFSEVPVHNLKFFIRKNQKDSSSPYRELGLDTPLKELFSGLVILEYPSIHVFLHSDHYDFKVNEVVKCPPTKPKPNDHIEDDIPCSVGTSFMEEEIVEDEEAPEPQIIDLLKCSEVVECEPSLHGIRMDDNIGKHISEVSTRAPTKSSPSDGSRKPAIERCSALPSSHGEELELLDSKIEDIQFDQDLMDAYSFLMDQSNTDDFLNFTPEGEGGDHEDTDVYFADMQELEEGEIPDFN